MLRMLQRLVHRETAVQPVMNPKLDGRLTATACLRLPEQGLWQTILQRRELRGIVKLRKSKE
ncbi:hypothetical protein RASY3_09855 [Ruminococcus albus SY3]|uniref:Uncharacterized protein n=1 Tax=Ruminococcus albus SY3 TaxID=1341156 RepID=A0A011VYB7_RUMAL|nr:hypothetical protein RASY3_09855 [Ruminococcus albus SY3]